jgi:hypothetical protein
MSGSSDSTSPLNGNGRSAYGAMAVEQFHRYARTMSVTDERWRSREHPVTSSLIQQGLPVAGLS